MGAHVDLEGTGTGAALVALWEGAYALIGVGLLGFVLRRGRGCGGLLLTAGAVVHEVRLQVPLAAVPDPTVFARENVLWKDKRRRKERFRTKRTSNPTYLIIKDSVTCYFYKLAEHFHILHICTDTTAKKLILQV